MVNFPTLSGTPFAPAFGNPSVAGAGAAVGTTVRAVVASAAGVVATGAEGAEVVAVGAADAVATGTAVGSEPQATNVAVTPKITANIR